MYRAPAFYLNFLLAVWNDTLITIPTAIQLVISDEPP